MSPLGPALSINIDLDLKEEFNYNIQIFTWCASINIWDLDSLALEYIFLNYIH